MVFATNISSTDPQRFHTSRIAPVLPPIVESGFEVKRTKVDSVASTSIAYDQMLWKWHLPAYLMSGTLGMRSAGEVYLPKEPAEEKQAYHNRVCRTVLYGAYSRTVKSYSSMPFVDPIIIKNIPESLEYLLDDATSKKESLASLGGQLVSDTINYGLCHVLIDFPVSPGFSNLLEERQSGLRPTFSRISPLNLLSWTFEGEELAQIRIYEPVVTKIGEFGETTVDQIRVITPSTVSLYRMLVDSKEEDSGSTHNPKFGTPSLSTDGENAAWTLFESHPNSLGKVGLVTGYGNKTGDLVAEPMLEELAWLNLRHYQKLSDLDNVEHVVNVPLLFGKGFAEDEVNTMEIGANTFVSSTEVNADLSYVEHSGDSIKAAQTSMDKIESRMIAMGADLLTQRSSGRQTATAKILDDTKSMSILEAIVRILEEVYEDSYKVAGEWLQLPAFKPSVTIGEGLDLNQVDNIVTELDSLHDKGKLSTQDFQHELQRRGKLSDNVQLIDVVIKKDDSSNNNSNNDSNQSSSKTEEA